MSDKAAVWNKGAVSYQRMLRTSQQLSPAYKVFAEDVASVAKQHSLTRPFEVLDIAAACGEPSFTLLAKDQQVNVTITDIAKDMVKLAREDAQQRGFTTAKFEVADGEDLSGWADGTFDAVMCSFALFMMDAKKALTEWKRVLRPGGFVAFSTWELPDKHDMANLISATNKKLCPDAPAAPFPLYDLSKPQEVFKLLADVGFTDGQHRELNIPLVLTAEDVDDMPNNAMMINVIEKNSSPGPDREAFAKRAVQELRQSAKERSLLQEDGSISAPTHNMLYFSAYKPYQ